ncbi:MAG: phosphatase PAP2 family protein [bacterium]
MQSVMDWGLQVIVVIQQVRTPLLDQMFRWITFMGEEQFYLLFLTALMWAVNFRVGAGIAIAFLLSVYVNSIVKDVLGLPRPFELDPSVRVESAVGAGLPSGHAQNGLVVWGALAAWAHRRWVWIVAVAVIVLLGFSRIYLGVHFPTDVLGGYGIGAVILFFYLRWHEAVPRSIGARPLGTQLLIALVVPVVLLLVWRTGDTVSAMGTLTGLSVGLVLKHRYVPFDAGGPAWRRVLRFLVGAIVLIVLYVGLSAVFPREGGAAEAFRFLRYGLLGIWAGLGAPWVFRLLRLADTTLVAGRRP